MKWLKRLFCKHDYRQFSKLEWLDDDMVVQTYGKQCKKCRKVVL